MPWKLASYLGRMVLRNTDGVAAPNPPPVIPQPTTPTTGVPPVTDGLTFAQRLKGWTAGENYEVISNFVYDSVATDVLISATVKWPDASLGTLTVTSVDRTLHQWTAYKITHDTTKATVTQSAITRNSAGVVTNKPPLAVTGI